ncbi:MAG: hypothetical protein CVU39_21225 [Chloroflexi bacterium HGW-Chloroflexi-10]|nr:MAG: hypothetical protein CVU39_21225 [Chloroflexi bacterium HGW-Chloroflexi-10]
MIIPEESDSVPIEEQKKYENYLFYFTRNSEIFHEGQPGDGCMYLLRSGEVGIFRDVGGQEEMTATVSAVNIIGEMSLLMGWDRTATIRVISNTAILYKFRYFDLNIIYSTAAYSEMLIKRLINDLKIVNDRMVETNTKYGLIDEQYTNLMKHGKIVFSAMNYVLENIANDSVINSKEWHYISAVREMMQNYVGEYLPEFKEVVSSNDETGFQNLKRIENDQLLPGILKNIIGKK